MRAPRVYRPAGPARALLRIQGLRAPLRFALTPGYLQVAPPALPLREHATDAVPYGRSSVAIAPRIPKRLATFWSRLRRCRSANNPTDSLPSFRAFGATLPQIFDLLT